MATPRKHWLRMYESLLDEDWDDATLATVVRLMCWLNRRWARTGIPHAEAGRATIPMLQLMTLTRRRRAEAALERLAACASAVTMTYEVRAGCVTIDWPKFSILQEYGERHNPVTGQSPGGDRVVNALETPSPTPTPAPDKRREEPPKPPSQGGTALELEAPRRRTRKRREAKPETDPPEVYTAEELAKLRAWCERTPDVRGQTGRVASLSEACLIHHRKRGLQSCDWYASAQTWIRNDLTFNPAPAPVAVVAPLTTEERLDRYSRVPPEPVRSYR